MTSMSEAPAAGRPAGLRERKKARTRAAIREHALRLFREQGYPATTVEQIAEAAEVSPSTFFRYFPTKEDVALADDLDPLIIDAFLAQPPEVRPAEALRRAMRQVYDSLPPDDWQRELARHELVAAVPELRAAMLDEMARTIDVFSQAMSSRLGRSPDDFALRTWIGAMMGVSLVAMLTAGGTGAETFMANIDKGLRYLDEGLPL
jgi:AcrR family transcriptional regulator